MGAYTILNLVREVAKVKIHIVQPDESLSTIATQYGISLDPLLNSNPGVDHETILEVGQKIKIPSNGIKVVKNQQLVNGSLGNTAGNTPLPKWWYEEDVGVQDNDNTESSTVSEFAPPLQELPEYPYAYYPATEPLPPAPVSSNYAFVPALPAHQPINNYDPYGAYAYIPAQPTPYSYGPFFSPVYEQAMMILASNRIPIPPRMVNINGMRSVKLPTSFFQLDDWNEDWEAEGQQD